MAHDGQVRDLRGERRAAQDDRAAAPVTQMGREMRRQQIGRGHIVIVEKQEDRRAAEKDAEILGRREPGRILPHAPHRQAGTEGVQHPRRVIR